MTARSAHHRDPRKCYRIILIAQRIYSKELEEEKTKKRTHTRTRRRSVSRIVIDFYSEQSIKREVDDDNNTNHRTEYASLRYKLSYSNNLALPYIVRSSAYAFG